MNTKLGLIGILGIWATMALMPLAQLLPHSPYQLMVLRGLPAVIVLAFLLRKGTTLPDRHTLALSATFAVATLALFEAIKSWGANLSAVLLDMAVLVNFAFALSRGEKITQRMVFTFSLAIFGSFLALRAWTGEVHLEGFLWSLLALVANGLFIESASSAKQDRNTKAFWQGTGLVLAGMLMSWTGGFQAYGESLPLALLFGVATGLLNFLFAFLAFGNLKPTQSGILILGVTPSILIGSWFILGATLGLDQIIGVIIILSSCYFLGREISKKH
jgi:drug/metabolite transporter (DMT)-like permease